jgi:uncharacterized protein (TIGR02246 family)
MQMIAELRGKPCGVFVLMSLVMLMACQSKRHPMDMTELTEFGTRYAKAWSSQDPALFASFYAENGSLVINDGKPSVGRAAVEQTAREFMTAFPDMLVKMVDVRWDGDHAIFRWHWTGTNTGPGGTGNSVDMTGYEEWSIDANNLILQSRGHLDEAEYQRQLHAGMQEGKPDS